MPSAWLCRSCYEALEGEGIRALALAQLPTKWLVLGMALTITGLVLVFLGLTLSKGGYVVLVPFPILVVDGITALIIMLILVMFFLVSSLAFLLFFKWSLIRAWRVHKWRVLHRPSGSSS